MGQFRWMAAGEIPQAFDLRSLGWVLSTDRDGAVQCLTIIHSPDFDDVQWMRVIASTTDEDRRMMLVSGVNSPVNRARLLAGGFGDVVADSTTLNELEARARRLLDFGHWIPRRRIMATLDLDLMAREAYFEGRPLNLHPREFALLWRLADTPNRTVSKETLMQDIWRLGYMPESNSFAVQLSRLRRKLAAADLADLVETVSGGYRLNDRLLNVNPTPMFIWPQPAAAEHTLAH